MERVYLDYAAATPLDSRVLAAMMPYLTTRYGNPSSLHYWGQQARAAVQRSREKIATSLAVPSTRMVFTGGGTEADNLAILGYLRANFPHGGHLVTTAVEHHAVLRTFAFLATQGYEVTQVPVQADGRVTADAVAAALRQDTVLVSVMAVNNETGACQPVEAIAALTRERHIAFHVDAVQSYGYRAWHPADTGIDLLTICSHKIYGPKGVGALYIGPGIQVVPDTYGGPQEHRLRAGTENVAAIVGFGKAAELLEQERPARICRVTALRTLLYESLLSSRDLRDIRYNGSRHHTAPHIINISLAGADSAVLLIALDRLGIAVSAGSACEAGAVRPSHVLQAMGVPDKWLRGSLRISLGKETTADDIRRFVAALQKVATGIYKGERL